MSRMPVKNIVLLTGAGFTRNFGGPLAQDVWSLLFNNGHIKERPKLVQSLRDNFDFEGVHHRVMASDHFDKKDRAAMERRWRGRWTTRTITLTPSSAITSFTRKRRLCSSYKNFYIALLGTINMRDIYSPSTKTCL